MTAVSLVVLAVIGVVVGSFLNVCIGRLPAGESVVLPGSRCPSCRAPIRWFDNIPIVSYVALAGRCRNCRAPIGLRYPVVELTTPVVFVLQGWAVGPDVPLLVARLLFTALLVVLFGTDLETERLPNVATLSGTAAGALLSLFVPPGIVESMFGIALGGGVLLLVRSGWKLATGVEGMGLGDVKMLAMVGAFLGWRLVIVVLCFASIGGALMGIVLVLRGRSTRTRLPFGTFLAVSAYITSLVGDRFLDWYLTIGR